MAMIRYWQQFAPGLSARAGPRSDTFAGGRGLILGRQLGANIVEMECEARIMSMRPESHPYFLALLALATPSLARKFMFLVREALQFPSAFGLVHQGFAF
eukprot:2888534-Pyramimonas_sp.AAC.1